MRTLEDASTGKTKLLGSLPTGTMTSFQCTTIAVIGAKIYVARPKTSTSGEILELPLAGGTPTVVAAIAVETPSYVSGRYPLAADASAVFIAGRPDIWKLPVSGAALEKVPVGTTAYYPNHILVDGDAIFTGGSGHVTRIPKPGGQATSRTDLSTTTYGLAVAGNSVFAGANLIAAVAHDLTGSLTVVTPDAAIALTSDATFVYATLVHSSSTPSAIKSSEIGVYDAATRAHVKTLSVQVEQLYSDTGLPTGKIIDAALSPTQKIAVNASHVFAHSSSTDFYAIPK